MNGTDSIASFHFSLKFQGKVFQILRRVMNEDNCYYCHRTPVIIVVPYVSNGSFVRTETVKWTPSNAAVYRKYLKYSVMLVQVAERISHDEVIKWKHFQRYWPFVREIHRSPVNSPHKGQWRGILMFSLICAWTNGWVNNREGGDLRRHRAHYDAIAMYNKHKHNLYVLESILFSGLDKTKRGNIMTDVVWYTLLRWYRASYCRHRWHMINI